MYLVFSIQLDVVSYSLDPCFGVVLAFVYVFKEVFYAGSGGHDVHMYVTVKEHQKRVVACDPFISKTHSSPTATSIHFPSTKTLNSRIVFVFFYSRVFNSARFVVDCCTISERLWQVLVAAFTVSIFVELHTGSVHIVSTAWFVYHVL